MIDYRQISWPLKLRRYRSHSITAEVHE